MRSVRSIGGVDVEVTSRSEVASHFNQSIQHRQKFYLAFANTNLVNFANRSSALRTALRRFHVINDGVGLQIASLARHGETFPENLNGTDLVPSLLENSPVPVRVFLFGATPQSVEGAAKALGALAPVQICGFRDGYSFRDKMSDLVNEINDANPDVVLVALGNPAQELWMGRYGAELNAPVVAAVGGLFDFLSGAHARAPRFMRRARLEWLHRLALEPKRLWRRYSIDIGYFMFCVLVKESTFIRGLEFLLAQLHHEVDMLREALDNTRRGT